MGSRTKGGAVVARKPARIVWKDAHKVDVERHPVPSTDERGAYLATLGDMRLRIESYTLPKSGSTLWGCYVEDANGARLNVEHHSESTAAGARAFVARVAARHAAGQRVAAAWDAEVGAVRVGRYTSSALGEIEMLRDHGAPSTSFAGSYAESLRAFSREVARRGFAFGPGGTVVETWRARARGRWIDGEGIVFPEQGHPGDVATCLVRVEGSRTLEVYAEGDEEWRAIVDGEDVCTMPTRAEAMRYALERVGVKDCAPAGRKARPA